VDPVPDPLLLRKSGSAGDDLPLLPNNLRANKFYTNREWCEVLTGYLKLDLRADGAGAVMWNWAERFTAFFSSRKQ